MGYECCHSNIIFARRDKIGATMAPEVTEVTFDVTEVA